MGLGNSKCDRCNKESKVLTGSYFNVQMICPCCETKEKSHSKYQEAKDAEHKAVVGGNFNFVGIGLPKELETH